MTQLLAAYLAGLILRSIGIALVAGICSWKIRNVAVRHAVWVAVLGAVLLMPAADYVLPASWVPARIHQVAAKQPASIRVASARATVPQPSAPAPAAVTLPNRPNPLNLWNVAAALYALVAFAMFVRLALGYRKMRKLRGTARAIPGTVFEVIIGSQRVRWRKPVLLESESVKVPMTIGFRRPAIILPADWKTWDDWKMRAVLLHEIAHVRRVDWGIAVVAAAAKCAYWLNPVSWILERQLSQLAEQSSDDATLSNTQNRTRYAEILLEFAVAAQSGGRLMKGGVAMAQPNMKVRIERVLGNPKTGKGIVRITGWALVMMAAAPVIYSAAALQVPSEPVKPPVAAFGTEFGRNPAPQTPVALPQAAPSPVPVTAAQPRQNSSNPSAALPDRFQAELENRDLLRMYEELKQKLAQAELAADQVNRGPAPDLQRAASISGSVAFLQDALKGIEARLSTVQVAMQQQSQANPPVPTPPDVLLDLPDNEDDLRAYLNKLAQLRGSFSVSVTGIQGRTINMKVASQDYSLGCENCSFFAGESAVSSASPTPSEPGIFVRLSSDGSNVNITCHAARCSVWEYEVLGAGSEQLSNPRQLESGLSELFRTSKQLRIVISKN